MTTNYNPRIVTSGLVVSLDAANLRSYPGSGTVMTDLTQNGNNGTLTNGPTFSSDNNGIITFDGTNDTIEGVHNTQTNITGDLTIECWFRITSTRTDWVRVFGKGDSSNRTFGLWYYMPSTSNFLYQRVGPSGFTNAQFNTTVSLNTWYYAAGTSIGNSHILYLNGTAVASSSLNSSFNSSTDPYKVGYGNIHTWHAGNLGFCQIYNRGLSAAEIQQNFNALRGRYGI